MSEPNNVFDQLEAGRIEYQQKMPARDGFSPAQQIAMATVHNQTVAGGSCMAIAVLISKPTLRALAAKGIVNERCELTRKGDDTLKQWWLSGRYTSQPAAEVNQ